MSIRRPREAERFDEYLRKQDFLPCSHGFRPGRSPHDALDAIGRTICRGPMAYVLEADRSDDRPD